MANNLTSNPLFVDTAAALWTAPGSTKRVKQIQWVDDAADIVDDSTLGLIINGVTITLQAQKTTDVGWQPTVAWEVGPFNPGIAVSDFEVSDMDEGNLIIWLD